MPKRSDVGSSLQPMISFAEQGEDVLLRRALNKTKGFYVDVGAAYPTVSSVTKYFYDLGWRGINIEPQPNIFKVLHTARPRDINLQCAVGTSRHDTRLTQFAGGWGLATSNKRAAAEHVRFGLTPTVIRVPTQTLNQILTQHRVTRIDFLKIDVEGSERDVLKSIDLNRWRPTVIVIESTLPMHPTPSFKSWELLLIRSGYRLALFDGLNRYYARAGDRRTLRLLSLPPNSFDMYVPYRWWQIIPSTFRRQFIRRQKARGRDMGIFLDFEKHARQTRKEYHQVYG